VATRKSAFNFAHLAGAAVLFVSACGGSPSGAAAPEGHARIPRRFDFVAIDGSRLSSRTVAGRPTVVVFITTYDLGSQVVMRELATVVRRRTPRINAGAIVLEPPKNAPLVDAYAHSLEIEFPIALADQATLEARGAFGPVNVVPTTVVLDADGNEVWRREGSMTRSEITEALDAVGGGERTRL
jgi:hypothetical protein